MRAGTHLLLGAVAGLALGLLGGGGALAGLCASAGALGGLLPDLDHPGSVIGRLLPWPAVASELRPGFTRHGRRLLRGRVMWHRNQTHSLGLAAIAGTAATGIGWWLGLRWGPALHALPVATGLCLGASVACGVVSHLLVDLAEPTPQMLLWPLSRRRWRPPWLPAARQGSAIAAVIELAMDLGAAALAVRMLR